MPSRLQRSDHALQDTPFEMKEAGIELRPAQLEGAGLLCCLEKMYYLGILANDMGLGKTIQLLALISQNRPTGIDKSTLLVVPAGAIEMWKVNIAKFQEIKYIEYNGYKKYFLGVEELSEYNVILSTYTHVSRQYNTYASRTCDIKAAVSGATCRKVRVGTSIVKEELDTQRPWAPLYGMTFHRIILDEAHRIRNFRRTQFKAMSQLQSHNRVMALFSTTTTPMWAPS